MRGDAFCRIGLATLIVLIPWASAGEALPAGVRKGIEEFNRREFFECHESIEEVWLDEPRDIRVFCQGILQMGVAFHHVQQGNWRGATNLFDRGLLKLEEFPAVCQGVDVAKLIADARKCETAVRDLGPNRLSEFDAELFPTIRFAR